MKNPGLYLANIVANMCSILAPSLSLQSYSMYIPSHSANMGRQHSIKSIHLFPSVKPHWRQYITEWQAFKFGEITYRTGVLDIKKMQLYFTATTAVKYNCI